MKDSEILRDVRFRIWSGTYYICWALNDTKLGSHKQRSSLKEWVVWMLQGEQSLNSWLQKHKSIPIDVSASRIKATRLAWLDWMIAYCEKEEAEQAK